MNDPYLYEDSSVLINKLGIKNQDELDKAESDISTVNLMTIDTVKGNYDYNHLKDIHKHIFGDIYEWAGTERTIPVEKSEAILNGLSVQYSSPDKIKHDASKAIDALNRTNWSELPIEQRAEKYAENIAAIWQSHPFREGNTRTTITYACEYTDAHGFPMDREIFARHSGYTRKALVMSSIGEYSDTSYLAKIFKDSMEQGKKKLEAIPIKTTTAATMNSRYLKTETNLPSVTDAQDKNINSKEIT